MKKLLLYMFAAAILLTAACQKGETTPSASPTQQAGQATPSPDHGLTGKDYEDMTQEQVLALQPAQEASGQLVIGSLEELERDFYKGWTSLSANISIQEMLEGYSTVTYTQDGYFIYDPVVVKDRTVVTDDAGNKTFTFVLHDNLVWSDGTPITAKDYVGGILMEASPEMAALEGFSSAVGDVYTGYKEYHNGTTRMFPGVRLVAEDTFCVTVSASTLPYFYDYTYAAVRPVPLHVLLPDAEIKDDGKGAYFAQGFSRERLRQAFLGQNADGYRYVPTTVCGPYQFASYDPDTESVILVANERYLGSYDGAKPQIKTLTWKKVSSETMFAELQEGTVDLLLGVAGKDAVEAGLALTDQGKAGNNVYPRNGYGKLALVCDDGPTQFREVRQALAYCLNREEVLQQYAGGYAITLNGYYGAAGLEYRQNREKLETELNAYSHDFDKAKELLIAGGWTKNESGQPFVEGTDTVRYKEIMGEDGIKQLMRLSINWMSSRNSAVTPILRALLLEGENGEKIRELGMEILENSVSVSELQNYYYHKDGYTKRYQMFSVGVTFQTIDYPQYYYNPLYIGTTYNTNRLEGEEGRQLYELAKSMAQTEPGRYEEYWEKWLDFQKYWNELLPDIPVYSENYYDFYNPLLKDYAGTSVWGIQYAILRVSLSD